MSNEELKAVVQEAIQADLFDNSPKCKEEYRDFCPFDCGSCHCVDTSLAPDYCPERKKVEVQKVFHTELDVDCSEPCQDCKCYDSFFDECVCVNYKDVPPSWCLYRLILK